MPPVGAPDTQPAPQAQQPLASENSMASQVAATDWHNANQQQFESNVPPKDAQTMPAEEAIPADVMPAALGAVKIPVAPAPADAATAFAPNPPENPAAPPTPNWEAMANSSKAGIEPTTPGTESPAATAYEELSPSKLDTEAAEGSEAQAFYEYMSNDPEAMLAVLQGALREDDAEKRSDKLRAIAPMIKGWLDRNITPR